jgi:hypothetical protein
MDLIALGEQKLGEIGAVLAGDARDQGLFSFNGLKSLASTAFRSGAYDPESQMIIWRHTHSNHAHRPFISSLASSIRIKTNPTSPLFQTGIPYLSHALTSAADDQES